MFLFVGLLICKMAKILWIYYFTNLIRPVDVVISRIFCHVIWCMLLDFGVSAKREDLFVHSSSTNILYNPLVVLCTPISRGRRLLYHRGKCFCRYDSARNHTPINFRMDFTFATTNALDSGPIRISNDSLCTEETPCCTYYYSIFCWGVQFE